MRGEEKRTPGAAQREMVQQKGCSASRAVGARHGRGVREVHHRKSDERSCWCVMMERGQGRTW